VKDPVSIVQEAGWTSLPVRTVAENLAPPGFDPVTVQPEASRYTDCALPVPTCPSATVNIITDLILLKAALNPICRLQALLGAHHILHVSRIRVNDVFL
jgi:hypothetical protein